MGLSGFLLLTGCSGTTEEPVTDEVRHVVISANDFKSDLDSRTQLTISSSGAVFSWAEKDTVGIFPNDGAQVYFPMEKGAGTKTARFTGGGWALKNGYTYAAYYPFIGNYYVNKEHLPLLYTGQKQQGNASTAHLGYYDYMAAPPAIPSEGYVNFLFDHLGCLVQLRLTIPVVTAFSSLTLSSEEPIFTTKAELALANNNYTSTSSEHSRDLELELSEIETTEEGQMLTFYMMLFPVNMTGTGKEVFVTLTGVNGKQYKGQLVSKDVLAGYSYDFQVVLSEEDMDNLSAEGVQAPSLGEEKEI